MGRARDLVETGLVWSGVPRWLTRGRGGRTLVLAYHNIVPDSASPTGDRSLHLPRARFAQQLEALVAWCDVVPLASILDAPSTGARPRVAITFDDAYRGALTIGAAELRMRGLPATMFVPPGLLGGGGFWWDVVAGESGLHDALRNEALGRLRGDGAEVRRWAQTAGRAIHEPPDFARPGTEAEVLTWSREPLFTVAAHTWRHQNLTRLAAPELDDELARPLQWLRERAPAASIPWLTYPYGLATPAVAAAAKGVGYVAALAVAGGWSTPGAPADPHWMPRLNIPAGLTANGFRLRLAGLIGTGVAPMQQSTGDTGVTVL